MNRFGSPVELANKYLEDEPTKHSVGKKIGGFTKKLVVGFSALLTLLVLGMLVLGWYSSRDRFDYANTAAQELDRSTEQWHSVQWDSTVNMIINQAQVVLYWHDKSTLDWNCGEQMNLNPQSNSPIKIRHDFCLMFLPKQATDIKITQSTVIIIQPLSNTSLDIQQSQLRIAEKESQYQFKISESSSDVDDFVSFPDATTTIEIKSEESEVEIYEY